MTNAENGLSALVAEAKNVSAMASNHDDTRSMNAEEWEPHGPLYASRVKVYPKLVHGTFRRLKWAVMLVTLSIYYLTPWIRWDRGPGLPDQAVLLDFPHRRFYFFFIEIWPQEFYYITGLLVLAALTLFLVTSVAGRVWCGYTCPQTVWTDLFIFVERMIEGDRAERMRLDRGPWTLGKVARKAVKHIAWLLIALATGGAWVFYFADAPTLAMQLLHFEAPTFALLFIALFTFTTYSLGGIAREQVCTYACPWPRIQGAMFDDESFLVSYKEDRGEKRGPHKKGTSWEGRGDCIDCGQCVVACPMGIDIRDGMQMECIQCALCIDACDTIMDRIERPRGLIGYDTMHNQERRIAGEPPVYKIVRPRTIVYAIALALVGFTMVYALATRDLLQVSILRDRNPLFVVLSDGSIRNGYTIKIINKEHVPHTFRVSAEGLDGIEIRSMTPANDDGVTIDLAPDTLKTVRLFLSLPKDKRGELVNGEGPVTIAATTTDTQQRAEGVTSFRGPK